MIWRTRSPSETITGADSASLVYSIPRWRASSENVEYARSSTRPMSTSSVRTVNRWASSFARSSTSPTSRPSRSASLGDDLERGVDRLGVVDDALAEGGDVAADRRQRRPQLVRDGHQEVALELLRLGEPRGHLAEAVGEVADLATAGDARHLDAVVAPGDLVGRVREGEHGPGDPAREVEGERAHDHEREEERDREPREQRHPGVAQLVLRLRDDQVAEHGRAARPDRVRGREERPFLPRRLELEGDDPRRREIDADVLERDARQAAVLARRQRRAEEVEPVAGRRLELGGREGRAPPSPRRRRARPTRRRAGRARVPHGEARSGRRCACSPGRGAAQSGS